MRLGTDDLIEHRVFSWVGVFKFLIARRLMQVNLLILAAILLRQAYDVAFADGALLEVDEPLLKAVNVQYMLTHGDFHQFLVLFKILQTQPTLPLVGHVG